MKFSELVAEVGHDADHIAAFDMGTGDEAKARVKRAPTNLIFCEDITEELALCAVKEQGTSIEYVPTSVQTAAVCLEAIANDPSSFRFMRNPNDDVIDAALQADGDNLQYLETSQKTEGAENH